MAKKSDEVTEDGIKIQSAALHSPILVPGVSSEIHLNISKIPDIQMRLMPYGLRCTAKNKEFIVPHANIKSMVLAK
jgi:hypothetical protein